jgi:hypothetical protein
MPYATTADYPNKVEQQLAVAGRAENNREDAIG